MIFTVVVERRNVSLNDFNFGDVKLAPVRPRRHARDPLE